MKVTLKFLMILMLFFSSILLGQDGMVTGRVIDEKTGDELMGANVIVEGMGAGGASDLDGVYRIYNIAPGTYSLRVSYIGYQTKKISNVVVTSDNVTTVDITLSTASLEMESVVVEAEAKKTGESYLLSKQKNSRNVQDGISASQMSSNGDSDAADAAKRIVGLSVVDDNTIVVRGLSGRYTQTEVNNAPMPSPDADKSDVPLDLFPTELLESVTARKTYTPDMPGVFAGGNINIKTKAYPDNRIFNTSLSFSNKSNVIGLDNYLQFGNTDNYFGYDSKREMPSIVPDNTKLTEWNTELSEDRTTRIGILGEAGRSFSTDFIPKYSSAPTQPLSFGLSFGDRFVLGENFEWGFFSNSTFSNSISYNEEQTAKYALSFNGLDSLVGFNNENSSYSTNLASSVSTGMKLFNSHKLSFHYIYTHNSEDMSKIGRGFANQFDEGLFLKNYYVEKQISNYTFNGVHNFDNFFNSEIEWSYAFGHSVLYQPDEKGMNLRSKTQEDRDDYLQLDVYSWSAGTRKYTEGEDNNNNFDLKYATYFTDGFGSKYRLNLGGRIQSKDRYFASRNFYHKYSTKYYSSTIPSDITVFEDESLIGSTFVDSNYFAVDADGNVTPGLIVVEDTRSNDAYEADEKINAGYFMIDIPLSFGYFAALRDIRLITGVRREDYQLELNPYDPVTGDRFVSNITGDTLFSEIDETKYLPSVNLIGKFNNNINVRASFSRTVARAEFREIAPFEYQAFYGGDVLVGYPYLKTTDIYNYDLRFEWYRKAGEVLALNFFKKDFDNPIEVSLIETSGKIYKTYQNAKSADNWGIEFDSRLGLDFIPVKYGKFTSSFNFTWTQTEVSVSDSVRMFTGIIVENEATSKNRALQGQSDFILNAGLYFNNLKGFNTALSYNFFSKRTAALGVSGIPDEFEYPFNSLNFTASQKWNKMKFSVKIKNLLNDEVRFGMEDEIHDKIKYTRIYKPGLSFSLGVQYDL
ncbi:MAG: carboxypeptidase-like regulatory domain-containing protein [Candidatus Marinimicrobia bacterium]|nr:carboxypeptidase-like regulatory domain-containing protein [Candidatus Neomarinimicrobiota bacterium]